MTFYQELQVNQAGSKKIIRESASQREKLYHIAVYLTKIAITVAFCFIFVSLYSLGFGADNSIVGVVVLLYLLVFRSAHLCIRTGQSTLLLAGFFGIMAVGPHAANLAGPVGGLFINAASIALLILFGCHEPRMFNQSTLVLGYLLLYGYDVSGHAYQMRLFGLAVGALLVCAVFYGNHRGNAYELCAGDILPAFDLHSLEWNAILLSGFFQDWYILCIKRTLVCIIKNIAAFIYMMVFCTFLEHRWLSFLFKRQIP